MNEKEMKFAEFYVECGDPQESALKAGYSEGTAKYASRWLNPNLSKYFKSEVAEYIKQLREKAQDARIMTAKERQITLSDMAKNAENAPTDRIKAIDVLNKMTGEYLVKVEAEVDTSITVSIDYGDKEDES
ncbi:MAG: terminase small subunit [Oscillospiraceae bacterium]|nr:terminase small subunit [Oscillospiraceae bacterium]